MTKLGIAAAVAVAGTILAPPLSAAEKILTPQDVKWSPAPAALPKGAEVSVIYGDPSKEGLFAMRLKMPKGYQIPPHTHPKPEVVTVISGAFRLGMGEKADPGKAKAVPVGGIFALDPGMPHYGSADGDTVLQLNSVGPWTLNYVNPKDDPRKTQ